MGIVQVGGGDIDGHRQAQGIDQQMPFSAFDAFMGVVPADASRLLDGLHALAVHDTCARIWVATHALALSAMQSGVERMPSSSEAKAPKMIEHGLPRWVVARQAQLVQLVRTR